MRPLLWHRPVSPAASQIWAASWRPDHRLEVSLAGGFRGRGLCLGAAEPCFSQPAELLPWAGTGSAISWSLALLLPLMPGALCADFSSHITASSGWPARSPRSSRPQLVEAAALGLPLEVSLGCEDPRRGSKAKRKLGTLQGGQGGKQETQGECCLPNINQMRKN